LDDGGLNLPCGRGKHPASDESQENAAAAEGEQDEGDSSCADVQIEESTGPFRKTPQVVRTAQASLKRLVPIRQKNMKKLTIMTPGPSAAKSRSFVVEGLLGASKIFGASGISAFEPYTTHEPSTTRARGGDAYSCSGDATGSSQTESKSARNSATACTSSDLTDATTHHLEPSAATAPGQSGNLVESDSKGLDSGCSASVHASKPNAFNTSERDSCGTSSSKSSSNAGGNDTGKEGVCGSSVGATEESETQQQNMDEEAGGACNSTGGDNEDADNNPKDKGGHDAAIDAQKQEVCKEAGMRATACTSLGSTNATAYNLDPETGATNTPGQSGSFFGSDFNGFGCSASVHASEPNASFEPRITSSSKSSSKEEARDTGGVAVDRQGVRGSSDGAGIKESKTQPQSMDGEADGAGNSSGEGQRGNEDANKDPKDKGGHDEEKDAKEQKLLVVHVESKTPGLRFTNESAHEGHCEVGRSLEWYSK